MFLHAFLCVCRFIGRWISTFRSCSVITASKQTSAVSLCVLLQGCKNTPCNGKAVHLHLVSFKICIKPTALLQWSYCLCCFSTGSGQLIVRDNAFSVSFSVFCWYLYIAVRYFNDILTTTKNLFVDDMEVGLQLCMLLLSLICYVHAWLWVKIDPWWVKFSVSLWAQNLSLRISLVFSAKQWTGNNSPAGNVVRQLGLLIHCYLHHKTFSLFVEAARLFWDVLTQAKTWCFGYREADIM